MAIPGFGEIAEQLRRSTVLIHSGGRGSGSGVIWSSEGTLTLYAALVPRFSCGMAANSKPLSIRATLCEISLNFTSTLQISQQFLLQILRKRVPASSRLPSAIPWASSARSQRA